VTTGPTKLQLKNVSAGYGRGAVLQDVSLEVKGGQIVALVGPSGCGKTTLLKVVAGLLRPTKGQVLFGDQVYTDFPPERRAAVAVFQKPLLFPYLTVGENGGFGLKMRKTPKPESARRVAEALSLVQLEGYEQRLPSELSGGQEQRVSLARAIVTEPRVLLLDEPFTALDAALRAEMRTLVASLQRRLRITTLFVTHDQDEAVRMADEVVLLLDGNVEQVGPPRNFYVAPETPRAAQFFGWKVAVGVFQGLKVETPIGSFASPPETPQDGVCTVAVYPHKARLAPPVESLPATSRHYLEGHIEAIHDLGPRLQYLVRLRSGDLIEVESYSLQADGSTSVQQVGDPVLVQIPSEAVRFYWRECKAGGKQFKKS
jgi:ABC-type Fe3+/spermidine/putrescine transport system ATPase subunit